VWPRHAQVTYFFEGHIRETQQWDLTEWSERCAGAPKAKGPKWWQ
jgi:hypothetical protein